jgi:hypothetical protein
MQASLQKLISLLFGELRPLSVGLTQLNLVPVTDVGPMDRAMESLEMFYDQNRVLKWRQAKQTSGFRW